MKTIKLTKGFEAIVDNEDFEWLNQFNWQYEKGYASRNLLINGKRTRIYMHREILNTPKDKESDHINHNKLDNRRKNLRVCTTQQNQFNRSAQINSISGLKGIRFRTDRNKWLVRININKKIKYLGMFEIKEDAINAYNKAATYYHGEFARLN